MAWVRIDDQFADHPKVVEAGPLALAMYVSALCYCNRHLTDGYVPRSVPKRLLDFDGIAWHWTSSDGLFGAGDDVTWEHVVDALVACELWYEAEDGDGWYVNDYLEYQRSAEEIRGLSEKRAEAGRRGATATNKKRSAQKATATTSASAAANVRQTSSNSDGKSSAEPQPQPHTDIASEEPTRRTRKRTPRDDVWDAIVDVCGYDPTQITDAMRGRIAKAVKQLVDVEATPDEIKRRANNARRMGWRSSQITPTSIAANWPALGQDATDSTERFEQHEVYR